MSTKIPAKINKQRTAQNASSRNKVIQGNVPQNEVQNAAQHATKNASSSFKDLRSEFPILKQKVRDLPLVYLDSAATTQKPLCVINAFQQYYSEMNANVHRGVHYLSEKATLAFENARTTVQKFINAKQSKECVFVRGTTEAINLLAFCLGEHCIQENDEILITALEHHSNIVPWQMLCQRKAAKLKVIPVNEKGELPANIADFFNASTKILAITHVSNAIGTINPIKKIIAAAHAKGIKVVVDGAQAAPHIKIDVQDLDCDFYAFSGHKVYGPTGIGVLYGKEDLLNALPPYQGGGEMILKVSFEASTYNELPYKFEAGTPAIAEAIALGKALDFISSLGFECIQSHERRLVMQTLELLRKFKGVSIVGEPEQRASIISFTLDDIHPHDIATVLDQQGVAIRAGHHCAMPLLNSLGVHATARVSFGIYNTEEDVHTFIQALQRAQKLFRR